MQDFSIQISTEIFFGSSQLDGFIRRSTAEAQSFLVLTGCGTVERLEYDEQVAEYLETMGVRVERFSGIEASPDVTTIAEATRCARSTGVDAIIGVGGGSVLDATKAVALLACTDETDIWPYVRGESREGAFREALPIFAVPTTGAASSSITPYAVVANRSMRGRRPIAYPFIRPTASWLNPAFTYTVPWSTTCDAACDTLSHVFENYLIGGNDSPLTDRYSEAVIASVLETLPQLHEDQKEYSLRATLMWASVLAFNGLQQVGRSHTIFPLHAIEHVMSAMQPSLSHGRGLATLFPAYFRWLWKEFRGRERMSRLAEQIFQVHYGEQFADKFEEWLVANDCRQSAQQVGICESHFQEIADLVIRIDGGGEPLNALGPLTAEDIVEILQMT